MTQFEIQFIITNSMKECRLINSLSHFSPHNRVIDGFAAQIPFVEHVCNFLHK